jgi:hypothetical protein
VKELHFGKSATSVELSCPPQKETLMGKIHQELFGRKELSCFGQRGGLAGPLSVQTLSFPKEMANAVAKRTS